jgi:hypothetical protein
MGDPAKDYYQERLVQAAWGQLSAAVAAGGYAPHHGLDPSAHGQVEHSFSGCHLSTKIK